MNRSRWDGGSTAGTYGSPNPQVAEDERSPNPKSALASNGKLVRLGTVNASNYNGDPASNRPAIPTKVV